MGTSGFHFFHGDLKPHFHELHRKRHWTPWESQWVPWNPNGHTWILIKSHGISSDFWGIPVGSHEIPMGILGFPQWGAPRGPPGAQGGPPGLGCPGKSTFFRNLGCPGKLDFQKSGVPRKNHFPQISPCTCASSTGGVLVTVGFLLVAACIMLVSGKGGGVAVQRTPSHAGQNSKAQADNLGFVVWCMYSCGGEGKPDKLPIKPDKKESMPASGVLWESGRWGNAAIGSPKTTTCLHLASPRGARKIDFFQESGGGEYSN